MTRGKERPKKEQEQLRALDQMRAWPAIEWGDVLHQEVALDITPYEIRIKFTPEGYTSLLMIIKAWDSEGGKVIAFQSGVNPVEMMASAYRRLQNGSLKWKRDEWRGDAGQNGGG